MNCNEDKLGGLTPEVIEMLDRMWEEELAFLFNEVAEDLLAGKCSAREAMDRIEAIRHRSVPRSETT